MRGRWALIDMSDRYRGDRMLHRRHCATIARRSQLDQHRAAQNWLDNWSSRYADSAQARYTIRNITSAIDDAIARLTNAVNEMASASLDTTRY